jgi:choline-sulfatase
MQKPDILIFLSDQHHGNYTGYAGHPIVRTPNLDRLAASGVTFDSAYTACPLCVPARSAFLTGQLPSVTGIFSNQGAIPEDQPTFIHSIAAEGYDTVLCGRMHFVGDDQRHGFTKRIMGEITPLYWGRGGKKRTDLGPYVGTFSKERCLEVVGGGDSPVLAYDRAVIQAALDYLQEDHEKPQCVVVGTYAPHFSYVAPTELYAYYRDIVELPRHNAADVLAGHPILAKKQNRIDGELMRDVRAAYFGMIENIDRQIGSVHEAWRQYLDRNERQGLFIYLSDHGDQAGEHHYYGKETFFEGSAKIPVVVAGHGIGSFQGGRRVQGAVSMLDIGPTLCDLIGAAAPPEQSGRSLLPQLLGGTEEPERAVVSEYAVRDETGRKVPARMVRKGNWKLISYTYFEEHDLLFDLASDPLEGTNLRHEQPSVYRELRTVLETGWDVPAIVKKQELKEAHYRLLSKWGANTDVEEAERWPVPESARRLPDPNPQREAGKQ